MEDREQIESVLMSMLDNLQAESRAFPLRQGNDSRGNNGRDNDRRESHRQTEIMNELLVSYNNNIRDYQRNISMLASILYMNGQQNVSSRPARTTRTARTARTSTASNNARTPPSSFNYYTQPKNQERVYYTSNIWNNIPSTTPSISGPLNNQEFENGTRSFVFSEDTASEVRDSICPISLEPHQQGDLLCEITGCHHIFNQANLVNWFRRSHLCPVCRYNVRTNAPQPTSPRNLETFDEGSGQSFHTDQYFTEILRSLNVEGVLETSANNEESDIPDNVSVD